MRTLKRIFLSFLVLILLVAVTLLVITFAYENEVKDYMVGQLNANLKTKVIVDSKNIQFSLFKNFPQASLNFHDVTMLEAPVSNSRSIKSGNKKFLKQDTLFTVEGISLHFSILDILSNNYVVKKISANSGKLKLRVGADGNGNWDVWKSGSDTASSSEESVFNMEKFILKDVSVSYFDFGSRDDASFFVERGAIAGEFTSQEYDLSITGDMNVDHYVIDSVNYLDKKPVKLDLNLHVDNSKNSYQFKDGQVFLSDFKFLIEGKYISNAASDFIDISLKGKELDVQSILSLLPAKYNTNGDYASEGEFYFSARISGKINKANSLEVNAHFGITKAEITQFSSGIVLKDVRLQGDYYASAAKDFLDLKSFSAVLANGTIAGSMRIDDLSSPWINASLTANLLLEDIRHLVKMDTIWNYPIQSLSGTMKVNMKYRGKLNNSGKYSRADFENMILLGDMKLENAGMKIKNSVLSFDSINGSFGLDNNIVVVNSFLGKTPKSDFYLKGVLKNILAYSLSDDSDVSVEATFQSNNFDLNEFLLDQQESSKRDTVYDVHFSPRINFILNSDVGHLVFRKFEATNLRGTFQLRNQRLIGDPISFSTMDGQVIASGMVDGTNDSVLLVTCDASLKRLNIHKLFLQFEDFGQSTMTHNNLKGVGTAQVQFASVWSNDLTPDLGRMYVRSDLMIEKGELVRFEPLKAMSKYVEVSELENIKFATLHNQIEVKDRKIFIPKMDISSSALDIALSGTHTFDNEIDYHVKVAMSDILFQKARKAKKENTEFGVVEDDKSGRTSLFISMTGTVDDPIIKYDKKGARQNLNENIAEEKQTLKQILRDEFGWFRKDSVSKKSKKPRDESKFIIKWEDEEKGNDKKEDEDF